MGLSDIITLIATNGMAIVIIAYFLFKDYKFNESILNVLSETKEVLAVLKDKHSKD
jgi:hypothetical protein